ncbi:MAG TPA: YggT family protein [Acidimicrobiales bacterium]|nr:YggT family protein [Actinomycetota bacterium]HEV2768314.1 YggT family protein [Acidimicrobiales bacterium]
MAEILCVLAQAYFFALLGRILLSWFPVSPDGLVATIFSFLYAITEPVLGPIRRVLPPVAMGGMGLDLSPIILIFVLQLVVFRLVC